MVSPFSEISNSHFYIHIFKVNKYNMAFFPLENKSASLGLTLKVLNTTIAESANTIGPDEMAHNEPSHLDLQCLPSSL